MNSFPVHRVIGRAAGLKELCVGLNEKDEFVWVEGELPPDTKIDTLPYKVLCRGLCQNSSELVLNGIDWNSVD